MKCSSFKHINTFADRHRHTCESMRRLFNSTTAESVSNHNEAELQRRCQERQQEIDHMQQVLETKIQLLQEVRPIATSGLLKLAWWKKNKKSGLFPRVLRSGSPASTQRGGEDGLAGWIAVPPLPPLLEHRDGGRPRWRQASQKSVTCQQQQRQVGNSKPAVKQTERNPAFTDRRSALRLIEELTKKLQAKEALITELSGEKTTLTLKVGELEVQVQELHSSLLQKDKDVEVSQSFSEKSFFNDLSVCRQTMCRAWVNMFYQLVIPRLNVQSVNLSSSTTYTSILILLNSCGPPCRSFCRLLFSKGAPDAACATFHKLVLTAIRVAYRSYT